jgi:hypothetical protein
MQKFLNGIGRLVAIAIVGVVIVRARTFESLTAARDNWRPWLLLAASLGVSAWTVLFCEVAVRCGVLGIGVMLGGCRL